MLCNKLNNCLEESKPHLHKTEPLMKTNFVSQLLIVAFSLAGIVVITDQAQSAPPAQRRSNSAKPPTTRPNGTNPARPTTTPPTSVTTVKCVNLVTIAEKNGRQAPVITWTTNYFGDKYTPQQRCNIVSAKLNSLVQANKGTFAGLQFQTGMVGKEMVMCARSAAQPSCNKNNMLFTLKPENKAISAQIASELTNFGFTGSSGIVEADGSGSSGDLSTIDVELEGTEVSVEQPEQPTTSGPLF